MDEAVLFAAYERTDGVPARYLEARYEFLDRVRSPYFGKVRDVLQEWYKGYPQSHRRDLRSRIRSGNDRQATAAFWELYLHEYLIRSGFAVTIHPELPGTTKQPDFLAERPEGGMYLEAVIAVPGSVEEDASESRVNQVFDLIDAISTPNFFLDVEVDEVGAQSIPTKVMRQELEAWLSALDPDQVTEALGDGNLFIDGPSRVFNPAGWSLRFVAVPKSAAFRGDSGSDQRAIGSMTVGRGGIVDRRAPIRKVLDYKASKYGKLDLPFVVAVHVQENFAGESTINKVLFGEEGTQLSTPQLAAVGLEGFFKTGRARPVSAVLTATDLAPWTAAKSIPTLWHNPSPIVPLALATSWRQVRLVNGEQVETPAGVAPNNLFGLSEPWPGPESPFE